ncbi:MBL fold metallo-hydrolase [Phanerochaete sordida]|uniref:MBL fold metallo-hydrolase n=1 Tax=Phanerochaete sordida TaxID=48140 RepID=A0A9P3LK58_9APHY|nr:MBL fold metallo-hydrolase [Phanerochaete sordida]
MIVAPPVPLPPDADSQAYVTVHALLVGGLWLPYNEVFQDCINEPHTVGSEIPCFAFLITHPKYGRSLFDLGMRKHAKGWPPGVDAAVEAFDVARHCEEDVVDALRKGGVDPAEITKVIYSHLHWDHVGDPLPFKNASIVVGSDAKTLLENAYPKNPKSRIMELPAHMPADYIDFANPQQYARVAPWGPYERAVDVYSDGSFYLIDSPGHMPGHLSATARVAPDTFIFLAGDTCHNRLCFAPGERLVSEENHADIETARATVRRLVRLDTEYPNIVTIIAHDAALKEVLPFFPGPDLRQWALGEVGKRKVGA